MARQTTMAQQAETLSLSAQAKLRAARAVSSGAVGADAPIRITVTPASFKGKDGKVVAGVRVGKHFMVPEHIDAILDTLSVVLTDVQAEAYLKLFA